MEAEAGEIHSEKAIHVKPATQPKAAGRYMLKGMHPALAREFGIRHEYQGWVTGKRIGCSKNIGPTELAKLRKEGKHPPARRWIHNKYANPK